MVVSVDKFTAVKMYDKVQHYWEEKLKDLYKERSRIKSRLEGILDAYLPDSYDRQSVLR